MGQTKRADVAALRTKTMRSFTFCVLTALTLAGVTTSQAADLDYGVLRGAEAEPYAPPIDWSGVYVGGHGGYTSANARTARTLQPFVLGALADTIYSSDISVSSGYLPGSAKGQAGSYGVMVGYNFQFDETVIGFEADYTHSLAGARSGYFTEFLPTESYDFAAVVGVSHVSLSDYGTIRARWGYAIGSIMPFVTAGVAAGRVTESNAVKTSFIRAGREVSPSRYVERTSDQYTLGYALGAGLDFAVTQNVILRAEYQFVRFEDDARHKIDVNTVRGGAAIKF